MTTTTIAVPRDVPDGYMPIPTAEQIADALENVRCFHDLGAELIAPELLANLLAAISAQQSAQPEFCCKHSYKVAKQAAWDACDLTHCKCDHNEYCEHCWPDDFREGGKWHGGFTEQQSAHVSVPRELAERIATHLEWDGEESLTVVQYANKCDALAGELRALLNGGEA